MDPQTLALLQRNVPSAPGSDPVTIFQREQLAAAMPGAAAGKAASLPYPSMVAGRPDFPAPNSLTGTTGIQGLVNDVVGGQKMLWGGLGNAAVGAGNAVSDFFTGGPPTSTATPRPAPIPPAVPESASPYGGYVPGGYDSGRQNYGIPQRQGSLGGPPHYAGSGSTMFSR
jgi:hypothetical protein